MKLVLQLKHVSSSFCYINTNRTKSFLILHTETIKLEENDHHLFKFLHITQEALLPPFLLESLAVQNPIKGSIIKRGLFHNTL